VLRRGPAQELVTFTSTDEAGFPVYHTNVMMAIGTDVAVVCAESVPDARERERLLAALRRHHHARPAPAPALHLRITSSSPYPLHPVLLSMVTAQEDALRVHAGACQGRQRAARRQRVPCHLAARAPSGGGAAAGAVACAGDRRAHNDTL